MKTIILLCILLFSSTAFAGKQDDRKKFLVELVQVGIIHKISIPGTIPRVYVTPIFNTINFDDKSLIVNVIWAYYSEKNNDTEQLIVLYDSITGKKIGFYGAVYGGLKLK